MKKNKMAAAKIIKRVYAYFCFKLFTQCFFLQFFFLLFVNYDVPFQKKNDNKFQDGRHWEQNSSQSVKSI